MANLRLREKLKPAVFFCPIVDNFDVKYVIKEHMDYLITSLWKDYSRITVD